MLEETIQTINQFEEEVFSQAESSSKKGKQVKILSRSPSRSLTIRPRTIIRQKLTNWEQILKKEILKIKEKITGVTHRKAHESRREYIFDFLNEISNKNDASIFALRGAINNMLEEYERDTNPAITITGDQFKAMPEWNQREVLNELLLEANNAQNEEARRAIQDKYRNLLAIQLKTKELPKTGYRKEYQYPGFPRSLPKLPTDSDKSSTNQTINSSAFERKRWILSITKRLRSLSPTEG
ncbi:14145_t:CDS:2 [Dentiscutata heterogama]|uniref:14145_t:CDS:1 n=1 Tax=Dentiscutata heterogama TaxID=1316150 RepID=A0ACA9MIH9_9GLOM|nr:14145_t:CDS:2 [Dentiscutata heterogama]